MLLGLGSMASAQKRDAVSVRSSGYLPGYTEVLNLEMVQDPTTYLCYSYNKETQDLTLVLLDPYAVFPKEESVEASYNATTKTLVLKATAQYDPNAPAPTTRIDRQWHAVIANVPMEAATIEATFVQEEISSGKQPKAQTFNWNLPISLETQPEGVKFKN